MEKDNKWNEVFKLPFHNYHGVIFDANHLLVGEFFHADDKLQKLVMESINGDNTKINYLVYSNNDNVINAKTEETIISVSAWYQLISDTGLYIDYFEAKDIKLSLASFIADKLNGLY